MQHGISGQFVDLELGYGAAINAAALAAHVTAAVGISGINVLARRSGAVLFEREEAV